MKCLKCKGSGVINSAIREFGETLQICPWCHGKGEQVKISKIPEILEVKKPDPEKRKKIEEILKGKYMYDYNWSDNFNLKLEMIFPNAFNSLQSDVKELNEKVDKNISLEFIGGKRFHTFMIKI